MNLATRSLESDPTAAGSALNQGAMHCKCKSRAMLARVSPLRVTLEIPAKNRSRLQKAVFSVRNRRQVTPNQPRMRARSASGVSTEIRS